jgi:hypothetical protein
MNRQAALRVLNDTINREGSGNKQWQRRTKSNNSFNRSGDSIFFMVLPAT